MKVDVEFLFSPSQKYDAGKLSLFIMCLQDARISSGINTVHLGKEVSVSVNAEESKMKYHKICNSFY